MNKTKAIAYAYPTSENAKKLGFYDSGCWYISVTLHDIEESGQSSTFFTHDAEGFDSPNDPDLIALFNEESGNICPMFLRHGNAQALKALNLWDLSAGRFCGS